MSPFRQYLCLLVCIFLLEIIAGVLAYMTYQEVIVPFVWKCLRGDVMSPLSHDRKRPKHHEIVLFLSHPISVLLKLFLSFSVRSCSWFSSSSSIPSTCCPVHSYPLDRFHTLLMSLSPLLLMPVFSFLLPGNALI